MASRSAAAPPALRDLKPETIRGAPGCFRVGQGSDGRWWLVAPDDTAFFGCGVDGVRRIGAEGSAAAVVARLREWHFNLLGPEGAPEFRGLGLPYLESLELLKAGGLPIRLAGVRLPDVFDPGWPEACDARVAATTPARDRVGFVTDADLGWAQPGAEARPSLLQVCLSLDPRHAAYHAAWEFVLAPHGGELGALARAWEADLPNKETLRQWTQEERRLDTPAYREAQARFAQEFVQRYLRAASAAVRRHAPGVLLFGPPLPAALRAAAGPWVDVSLAAGPGPGGGPVLVAGFCWTPPAGDAGGRSGLSRLERMHRRGRASLEALVADPAAIGYLWGEYAHGDAAVHAPFGRGLVYEDGATAHEHVQPLASINRMATARRAR